ncbi:hypothetical protein RYH80_07920 [Halobaculum sp. MBLA0147]|uniref:DUF7089 family protein n=1 Tax=Halobaculum sp. MBLA0147 TaxID=3079934 RepID=UPI0035251FCA
MFERRSLSEPLAAVRDAYAPDALVLDTDADFETLPPETAEELGLLVDSLDPVAYPTDWLPPNAPEPLRRYAGTDFTVGLPGDGTVVWTRQTDPPTVLVKHRADGTPDAFLSFLLAEAFVELGVGAPESFLPFFGESYAKLAAATPVGPADTYQLAAALCDAWVGLYTREVFRSWGTGERAGDRTAQTVLADLVDPGPAAAVSDAGAGASATPTLAALDRVVGDAPPDDRDGPTSGEPEGTAGESPTFGPYPELYDAWRDAGERLSGRLGDLSSEVAHGRTTFPAATEYACSAVKHDLSLPAPFGALATAAYREHAAPFAVEWAKKTYERLEEEA